MPSSPSPSPPRDSSKTQEDSVNGSATDSPTVAHDTLTLRALVTTKEAGIIIGKSGKNVADIRDQSGVKAGVSKVVPGVHERVLSVTGSVEAVAKAYTLIINQLLANAPPSSPSQTASNSGYSPSSTNTSVNLLISHNLMGTIIGRNGLKIKAIQDSSGARMVAEKEMLPQSTERIVVVQGTADSIGTAIEEIGKCLLEDWERGVGTVLFHPGTTEGRSHPARRSSNAYSSGGNLSGVPRRNGDLSHQSSSYNQSNSTPPYNNNNNNNNNNSNSNSNSNNHRHHNSSPPSRHHHHHSHHHGHNSSSSLHRSSSPNGLTGVTSSSSPSSPQSGNLRTQNISIPSDMVGCIIGRGGTKITEIRRLSGSKISIAKTPHDETGERMFTIIGTSESNEKALFLLYNQLEMEKERRVGREGSTDVQD